jgi:hypothetical protein
MMKILLHHQQMQAVNLEAQALAVQALMQTWLVWKKKFLAVKHRLMEVQLMHQKQQPVAKAFLKKAQLT